MTTEITVGPPVLTINHSSTFVVTDRQGEIHPDQELGIFAADTRFVGYYRCTIERQPWVLLTSSTTSYRDMCLVYTNPALPALDDPLPGLPQGKGRTFPGVRGNIPASQLGLTVTRSVDDTIQERLAVTNYGVMAVRFHLDLSIRSDFVDLFDVKAHRYFSRGDASSAWHAGDDHWDLVVEYANGDFQRTFTYRVTRSMSPPRYENGRIEWTIDLAPAARWEADAVMLLDAGQGTAAAPAGPAPSADWEADWAARTTQLTTSHCTAAATYRQAVEDMAALRIHSPDLPPDEWVPAAGVPWFVTLFGRDSLIVSYQTLSVYPSFARGALKQLAAFQATERDDWRDAQPGKILHELRHGELAHFELIPQTPYYGTWDATTLYVILLHETWKWTGDRGLLEAFLPVAERCLQWIDQYGDLDGDGFQEYKTFSYQGYENMGWKDSGVAVVYPDGSQVKQPKALCELQGYVYDAKRRMAEIYRALDQPARAEALDHEAAALRAAFNARFWLEDEGIYAFGLDPDKKPIATVSSNPGHCLWSGIVPPERAVRVVDRLLQPDMWSGWGIRTLTTRNPSYNPFTYQNGAVWPHDNSLIAAGCKRYGLADAANRIAEAIFDAAARFEAYRLPELYAGLDRAETVFPVQYLGANIPQAWAAGSILLLVQTMLGLRADAPAGRLYLDPVLPTWLPDLTLNNLSIGGARLQLTCWRADNSPEAPTRWSVEQESGPLIEVVAAPPPLP